MSVELFRYRGAAKDGGTLEYVFEAGEQNSPNAVRKRRRLRLRLVPCDENRNGPECSGTISRQYPEAFRPVCGGNIITHARLGLSACRRPAPDVRTEVNPDIFELVNSM